MLTDEQREKRRNHLGASDIPAITGANDWVTPWHVYWSKMPENEWPESYAKFANRGESDSLKLGNTLEPAVIQLAADYLQVKPEDMSLDTEHLHHGQIILVHPDAEAPYHVYRKKQAGPVLVEAKTTGFNGKPLEAWGRAGSQDIPLRAYMQIQTQLMAARLDTAWLALLSGHDASGLKMYRVLADKDIQSLIEKAALHFWTQHVIPKKPPKEPAQ